MDCSKCGETLTDETLPCPACGVVAQDGPGMQRRFGDYLKPPQAQTGPGWVQVGQQISGKAIASLVLSLLVICGIGSVLGLLYGYRARREIAASHGWLLGDGMARAGIIIGWVGLALVLLLGLGMVAIRS